MADQDCESKLQEAKDALHALHLGRRVTVVWRDGNRIEYQPGDETRLQAYISSLEAQCGARRRPVGVRF